MLIMVLDLLNLEKKKRAQKIPAWISFDKLSFCLVYFIKVLNYSSLYLSLLLKKLIP